MLPCYNQNKNDIKLVPPDQLKHKKTEPRENFSQKIQLVAYRVKTLGNAAEPRKKNSMAAPNLRALFKLIVKLRNQEPVFR
jgi:hypothetical protein